MKKDAYYFPHFSNARHDPKITKLRRVLGIEGYGIYFIILEILRDQTDWKFPVEGIPDLEFELRVSKEKIIAVINDFDLFELTDDGHFFSPKLIQYLQPYIEKSLKARESARIRWSNANALQAHTERNSDAMQVKERKGKESKAKESKEEQALIESTGFGDQFHLSWCEWMTYRSSRRLATSMITIKKQLSMLSGHSETDAIAMINQSLQNGWSGLFEIKNQKAKGKSIDLKNEIRNIYE